MSDLNIDHDLDNKLLNLENGKKFVVETIDNSSANKYIQSIELNGENIKRNYISHTEIMKGGKLIFKMGNLPEKKMNYAQGLSSKIYNKK